MQIVITIDGLEKAKCETTEHVMIQPSCLEVSEAEVHLARYSKIDAIKCLRRRRMEALDSSQLSDKRHRCSLLECKRDIESAMTAQQATPISWVHTDTYNDLQKVLASTDRALLDSLDKIRQQAHYKNTPQQWCDMFRFKILDPDGWRNIKTSIDTPCTLMQFLERATHCTVDRIA